MISVLFVCLGNICRSPAAAAVLLYLNEKKESPIELHVESCGIGSWHVGQLPTEKMREASEKRGVLLSTRAQQFDPSFLDAFDLVLAADQSVLHELYHYAKTAEKKAKIHLITEHSSNYYREEIPDPYSQGEPAFEIVLDMIEDSCEGLLEHFKNRAE